MKVWKNVLKASAVATGLAVLASTGDASATDSGIGVASMPAYVVASDAQWTTMLSSQGRLPEQLILNPNNGENSFDASWQSLAHRLHQRGVRLLGYVYTSRGTRSIADVEASIDNYFPPGAVPGDTTVDGIFFDEFSTVDANGNTTCDGTTHYDTIAGYTYDKFRAVAGRKFRASIWANPGTAVPSCYLNLPNQYDTFVTAENFEAGYDTYIPFNVKNADGSFTSGAGVYPSERFAHLVYCVPSADVHHVVDRAYANYAGYVFTSSDTTTACHPLNGDNPWDNFPSNDYLTELVRYAGSK